MAGIARIVGTKALEKALLSAFQQWTEDDVNGEYWREQFEKDYKYANRITKRKEKPPAENPRDILDTEELYESGVKSYDYSVNNIGARADWHWNAKNSSGEEYAWYVHEALEGSSKGYPRRWTDELASEYLFEDSEIKGRLMSRIDQSLNG
jgi:hypothetical protein